MIGDRIQLTESFVREVIAELQRSWIGRLAFGKAVRRILARKIP